jgi:hypothetical protein
MELWVRTQDKEDLIKIDKVQYRGVSKHGILCDLHYLGEYETKERCLEIIDEIQKLLLRTNGDYLIKLQDIDVNAEEKTVYGENFIQKLQNSPIMPIANEPSVQFIQPSVLVYEMPKE